MASLNTLESLSFFDLRYCRVISFSVVFWEFVLSMKRVLYLLYISELRSFVKIRVKIFTTGTDSRELLAIFENHMPYLFIERLGRRLTPLATDDQGAMLVMHRHSRFQWLPATVLLLTSL